MIIHFIKDNLGANNFMLDIRTNLFMNFTQLFAEEEEKLGTEWVACYGINKSLDIIFEDRVHIIDPGLSSINSPADSNFGLENYIE